MPVPDDQYLWDRGYRAYQFYRGLNFPQGGLPAYLWHAVVVQGLYPLWAAAKVLGKPQALVDQIQADILSQMTTQINTYHYATDGYYWVSAAFTGYPGNPEYKDNGWNWGIARPLALAYNATKADLFRTALRGNANAYLQLPASAFWGIPDTVDGTFTVIIVDNAVPNWNFASCAIMHWAALLLNTESYRTWANNLMAQTFNRQLATGGYNYDAVFDPTERMHYNMSMLYFQSWTYGCGRPFGELPWIKLGHRVMQKDIYCLADNFGYDYTGSVRLPQYHAADAYMLYEKLTGRDSQATFKVKNYERWQGLDGRHTSYAADSEGMQLLTFPLIGVLFRHGLNILLEPLKQSEVVF